MLVSVHALRAAQEAALEKEQLAAQRAAALAAPVRLRGRSAPGAPPRPPQPMPRLYADGSRKCSPPPLPRPGGGPLACEAAAAGLACVFPFLWRGSWRRSCAEAGGRCAARVDARGRAVALTDCAGECPGGGELRCAGFDPPAAPAQPCAAADAADATGVCRCKAAGAEAAWGAPVPGGAAAPGRCDAACADAALDLMSLAHSAAQLDNASGGSGDATEGLSAAALAQTVRAGCATAAPADATDLEAWRRFADLLPPDGAVLPLWCGRGVAIMAGSADTLPQALVTVALMRGTLNSTLPVEIWRAPDEAAPLPEGLRSALSRLGVALRTVPRDFSSGAGESELFSLKPAVALLSSFDSVLLLDADAVPLVSPAQIIALRPPGASAVFWPDFWTLLHDAAIWDAVGGWPHGSVRYAPSQDSGVMVVCKSCGGWRPLAVAAFINYHAGVYYPAIYRGHWQERVCRARKCAQGHDVPGAGDKDTFQVAWHALGQQAVMMPPAAVAGPMLPKRGHVCGTAFLQRDTARRIVVLHHNSNKFWWRDFAAGLWVKWRGGLGISHVASYANDSAAFQADGTNDWRAVTYGDRPDAGRQSVPPVSRWCIVYRGNVLVDTLADAVGWDPEDALLTYLHQYYSAPWMVDWASSVPSALEELAQCAVRRGWIAPEEAELRPGEARNAVIDGLGRRAGAGVISFLQGLSDRRLLRRCNSAAPAGRG
eukprot:TRINITY_DN20669_c0_g2_i1.p1 TRINITY_DN20669_c0_g2~~TRINITY_DN20669_c0_g2_i1.p1  ORF type:complete len:735 (+),score=175.71 TRINITY_DN20669_c0_g2_i1:67-2205(+)